MTNNIKVLVTGAAGFIGFHLVRRLIQEGYEVIGLDNINDYYDVNLKFARLAELGIYQNEITDSKICRSETLHHFRFIRLFLEDRDNLKDFMANNPIDFVCHLAAQAGVRYSVENPNAYVSANVTGFLSLLEGMNDCGIKRIIYASSSSVYGKNDNIPFTETDAVDQPLSIYGATKKANELFANVFSNLYGFQATGLRFFTVYGPWARPDMALFLFTDAILKGRPIRIFNNGDMARDFTYIDDIVEGIFKIIDLQKKYAPIQQHHIYNIGNNSPVKLTEFIEILENEIGVTAKKEMKPMQSGDMPVTYASVEKLIVDFGYSPSTPLEKGIKNFVRWYRDFYKA